MSLVERFAPHLPCLRRYARALTGSQESGDAYVRASLAALAEAPEAIETHADMSERTALYRFCHGIWASSGARLAGRSGEELPDKRLQSLAPRQRQAFLLTAMEGFSTAEAGAILESTVEEVEQLIVQAHKEIEEDLVTRVLIIEDEPIIAADLEAIVGELGHSVTGHATTHDEAVRLAERQPPGLVLCDIQLADDSSGLEAAEEILESFDVPVIFITAFPERLLTGERREPAYLITKPFQPNGVKAAVAQALFFNGASA